MSSYPEPLTDDDILFKIDNWMILSTDKLAGFRKQDTVIGHRCPQFKGDETQDEEDVDGGPIQFLDEEDALFGACWWCRQEIPQEIQALWRLQNMDKIPEMNRYTPQQYHYTNPPGTVVCRNGEIERVFTDTGSKLKQYGMIFILSPEYRDE